MSRPRKPVCGRPVKVYYLNRLREFETEYPVCGLPEGHKSNCVSEESVEHMRKVRTARRHG